MAVDNCTRVCANCEAQFKRDRKGQSTKYCQKCCEEAGACNHCGKIVKATPSKPKKFCSRVCHAKHKTVRVKSVTCRYCKETKKRVVRKTGDAGLYCSRSCAASVAGLVRTEVASLKRIGEYSNRKKSDLLKGSKQIRWL